MDKILKLKGDLFDIRTQLDLLDKQKNEYAQLYNQKLAELDALIREENENKKETAVPDNA